MCCIPLSVAVHNHPLHSSRTATLLLLQPFSFQVNRTLFLYGGTTAAAAAAVTGTAFLVHNRFIILILYSGCPYQMMSPAAAVARAHAMVATPPTQ